MTRTQIDIYNTDKYQAVMPSPKIEAIEGSDLEVIISADGTEDSASGGVPSTITMNASAGVWYDTGVVTSYNTFSYTTATTNQEVIHIFDKTVFRTARVNIMLQSGANYKTQDVYIVHNNSNAGVTPTTPAEVGQGSITATYAVAINNNDVELKITAPASTIIKGVVQYIAI